MAAVKTALASGLKAVAEPLICFGLKAVFNIEAEAVVGWLKNRATDHSQALPKAITTANERAWNAVALALGGESFWQRVCDLGRSGDVKAVRDQMRKFIAAADFGPERVPADVRLDACTELKRLSADGLMSEAVELDPQDLGRFADLARNVTDAHRAISAVADSLTPSYPNLARVLALTPTNGGPPLLAAAFAFFLRQEIATHEELFREVTLDGLRDLRQYLTAAQVNGFGSLEESLAAGFGELGGRLDTLNQTVLDLASELRAERDAVRRERQEWRERNEVRTRTATGQIELSCKSDGERDRLRGLRDRLRKLADTYPEFVPAADLNGMGDDLDAAELFQEALDAHLHAQRVARVEQDKKAEAEAEFRSYQSACEILDYPTALTHLLRAAALDPVRFSPFNRGKYHPIRILGHGGFGTVFLCEDRDESRHVAVKALRAESLGCDPRRVFDEAFTLRRLHQPNSRFVQVLHCDYAHTDPHDPTRRERPFIVMEFFDGEPLDRLKAGQRKWPHTAAEAVSVFRQIAEAVHEAHQAGVYHRDLKPSNVLAKRHPDGTWEVRVIDFGLAVKTLTPGAGLTRSTKADRGFTGTWDYAPPEQRGKAPHIKIGPWSDVFAFGKSMAMALCGNTEVNDRSWKHLDAWTRWTALYQDCVEVELREAGEHEGRYRSFAPVLERLREIELEVDPAAKAIAQKAEEERRRREEEVRRQAGEAQRLAEQKARDERERRDRDAEQHRKEKEERERLLAELAEANRQRADAERLATERLCAANLERWKASDEPRRLVTERIAKNITTIGNVVSELAREGRYWPMRDTAVVDHLERLQTRMVEEHRAEQHRQESERKHTKLPEWSTTCEGCQCTLNFPREFAGKPTECPECNTKIMLPVRDGERSKQTDHEGRVFGSPSTTDVAPAPESDSHFEDSDLDLAIEMEADEEDVYSTAYTSSALYGQQHIDEGELAPPPMVKVVRTGGDRFDLELPDGGAHMAFAWCPPGSFLMGSPGSEAEREDDEFQHEVRLTKGFYCGVHPVTRGEFARFVAQTKYKTEAETSGGAQKWTGSDWELDPSTNWRDPGITQADYGPVTVVNWNDPVTVVSWNDAMAFCKWLTDESKRKVRLPTEAEWEYACRGGTTTPFFWGGELNGTQANCLGNYPYGTDATGPYLESTSPVGRYAADFPHPWGLADVHGNVSEWCADWYDAGFYARSPADDPECRDGEQKCRILRGGSWADTARVCRAAHRIRNVPEYHDLDCGFRVVFCPD